MRRPESTSADSTTGVRTNADGRTERGADPGRRGHSHGRAAAALLVSGRLHPRARGVPGPARAAARRGLRRVQDAARPVRDAAGGLPAPAGLAGLRRGGGRRAALPVPRLAVRDRRHLPGPARRAGGDQLPRPGPGGRRAGAGARRPDLGLHRALARAGAAAVRRVRDGRGAGHRLDRPALQLRADHGERRRPAPHRVAARQVLRVHGAPPGLRRAALVRQEARQGGLRRVRVGHHQAPGGRGRVRGGRRLEDRPPAGVPLQHAGRRGEHRADADPGAGRPDHHPVHAVHGARAGRRGVPRSAAGARLPDPASTTRTAGTGWTTSRART